MGTSYQPENPEIELINEGDGEVTLLIDGEQAMQAWERELMWESADMLCTYGSNFLEVGLGLGISALRIASNPATRKHVVVEKYERVIDLFRAEHPSLPPTLEIVHADFFEYVHHLEAESLDGIFFDPYVPEEVRNDEELWSRVVPLIVRALRVGGVLVPFFSTRPVLRWQFVPFFERVLVERRTFRAYETTNYVTSSGQAFIQVFIKT